MAASMLPALDTSPEMKALVNGGPLSPKNTTLRNDQDGALPLTPLSPDPNSKMPYNLQWKRELEEYRAIFNQNMKNKPVKHDKVHVFMWTWDEDQDDLKVKKEVDALQKVFEEQYSFEVERKEIRNPKAEHQLKGYLGTFMHNHDNENTLLIFYYAGHGVYRDSTFELTGTKAQQTPKEKRNNIAWKSAEGNIKADNADVLVIFDCCAAGGFGGFNISGRSQTEPPPFQCLAACGSEELTRKPGPKSFTSALIWALEQLRRHHPGPFTSQNLLAKIKEYKELPKTQTPMLLKREEFNDGLVWLAPLNAKHEAFESSGEHRNPLHEHMDIRLHFYRRVGKKDAVNVARCLSKLIHENHLFQAKHVALLEKSNVFSQAVRGFHSGIEVRKRKRPSSSSTLTVSPTALRDRRKSVTYADEIEASPDEIIEPDLLSPPPKRIKASEAVTSTQPSQTPSPLPQSAWYHFRMAVHCSLQNVKSQIGSISERIRPGAVHLRDSPNGPHPLVP